MIERPLEELLRDPRAHGAPPSPEEVRALQEAVLQRYTAERRMKSAPARPLSALVWAERSALAATAIFCLYALADWLRGLWFETDSAVRSSLPAAPDGGWVKAAVDALQAQPVTGTAILAALALLLLPPVRQALVRELR